MRIAAIAVVLVGAAGAGLSSGPSTSAPTEEYQLIAIPSTAVHHGAARAPRIRDKNGTSTNWSGYAIPAGTTTDVKGTWVVPNTSYSGTSTTYSSSWVGIDGYDTNTVEQLGTEDDWTGGASGSQRHYAWFEMYPHWAFLINNFPVVPGDTISAEVKVTGRGKYLLSITNVTRSKTFSTTQRMMSAANGSAEWVVEAPWSGGVLPLANFGTVTFSACSATIDGVHRSLNDAALTPDPITMVNGSTNKAVPSYPLTTDGFTVDWNHE